ncbi:hypothetical protein H6503_03020 [Candidatus Woesearchaeota archaeon]|nr:hypothetical protein [Candidatus Woesearchaeota archaeon]
MYNTIKPRVCPRCRQKVFGESAHCENCLCNLLLNKSQEANANWSISKLD